MTDTAPTPEQDDEVKKIVAAIRSDGWNNGFDTEDNPWIDQLLAWRNAYAERKVVEARVDELKALPTPKVDEINHWANRKAKFAATKEAAFIQGARFMRNRVQQHKGQRLATLSPKPEEESDAKTN